MSEEAYGGAPCVNRQRQVLKLRCDLPGRPNMQAHTMWCMPPKCNLHITGRPRPSEGNNTQLHTSGHITQSGQGGECCWWGRRVTPGTQMTVA